MGAETVFISYSHDSPEHSDRVLELSNTLRRMGVNAKLDRYQVRPEHGWPHWCEEGLRPENAKYVLVICTPTYRSRVENEVSADEGRGVYWVCSGTRRMTASRSPCAPTHAIASCPSI
jgi:hypothetical protein